MAEINTPTDGFYLPWLILAIWHWHHRHHDHGDDGEMRQRNLVEAGGYWEVALFGSCWDWGGREC